MIKIYVSNNAPIQVQKEKCNKDNKNQENVLYESEVRKLTEELFDDVRFNEWDKKYQEAMVKTVATVLILKKANVPNEDFRMKTCEKAINQIIDEATRELPDDMGNDPYMNRVVTEILIPLIDPHFDERDKQLQKIIHNDIYDFYLLILTFPNADGKNMIRILQNTLNYDIEQYEKQKKKR